MHRSGAANAECDVVASSSFSESWQSDVQQSHIIILFIWKPSSRLRRGTLRITTALPYLLHVL